MKQLGFIYIPAEEEEPPVDTPWGLSGPGSGGEPGGPGGPSGFCSFVGEGGTYASWKDCIDDPVSGDRSGQCESVEYEIGWAAANAPSGTILSFSIWGPISSVTQTLVGRTPTDGWVYQLGVTGFSAGGNPRSFLVDRTYGEAQGPIVFKGITRVDSQPDDC